MKKVIHHLKRALGFTAIALFAIPFTSSAGWEDVVDWEKDSWQYLESLSLYSMGGGWHWVDVAEVWIYSLESGDGTNSLPFSGTLQQVEGGTLSTSNELDGSSVSTFYIGRYEVTWGEWQEVRSWAIDNGYDLDEIGEGCADDHPVHSVNWFDVLKWSNAKSEKEGLTPVFYTDDNSVFRSGEPHFTSIDPIAQNYSADGYRLPLDAEWEFAARGGNYSNGYTYAGSNDLDEVGWFRDNSGMAECNLGDAYLFIGGEGTWPVGQKAPNELGLYDMSGNVFEWCWEAQANEYRFLRGGSWLSPADLCTTSFRPTSGPQARFANLGFRLARSSGNWHLNNAWIKKTEGNWHWIAGADVWIYVYDPNEQVAAGEMVLVEGGTLSTSNELDGSTVSTFYIGRYEVTWGEWQEVHAWATNNGYEWISGPDFIEPSGCNNDHPVHSVSWYDAVKWCNAKSEKHGLTPAYTISGSVYRNGEPDHTTISQDLSTNGYRLPLEAEWEFAARGGNQSQGYTYSGSNDLDEVGWYRDNTIGAKCILLPEFLSEHGTWPVGQKLANELGLHDMSGNVWEWCWGKEGNRRHLRGGCWGCTAENSTVSHQYLIPPDRRPSSIGFRLARSSMQ